MELLCILQILWICGILDSEFKIQSSKLKIIESLRDDIIQTMAFNF